MSATIGVRRRRLELVGVAGLLTIAAVTVTSGCLGNGGASGPPVGSAGAARSQPQPVSAAGTYEPGAASVSPTSIPTPSPDLSVSGEPLPTGEPRGWRLLVADDFAVDVEEGDFPDPVASRWDVYPRTWRDTSGTGTYSPEIVSIHDGVMDIHLRTEDGVTKVAAPVPLLPGVDGWGGQTHGRYAIRFRADPVPGYKTAWLLWPRSEDWPRDGEIDFPEGNLTATMSAYLHHKGATTGGDQAAFPTNARYATWHTAVIEWRPGRCEFFLDSVSIGATTTRVPDTAMRWVIQTETLLSGVRPPDDAEGHVLIDWIAIWAYQP